ncbi:HD domain-containing protein [Streptomyces misionensis]|uniref:HD domain-containing protein n=1 Tax=Streptomyces misionensis TaxID=67331 RepID=A0A5C6K3T9_9ACTN|nr:HD domain-containing protein [Streptomyces misionensis]TWV57775.1 HD domain-containing protein [Streptomyces misionensis]
MHWPLPDTPLIHTVHNFVSTQVSAPILHHSVRVGSLSQLIAEREQIDVPEDSIWAAALLHDVGTAVGQSSPQRFEVAGANAATELLKAQSGLSGVQLQEVWDAIALHTSPHIAEARGGLTRVIRLGVLMDFGKDVLPDAAEVRKELERAWPRADIERTLTNAVVQQALQVPEKAPAASWPNNLYVAHLQNPNHTGINPAF